MAAMTEEYFHPLVTLTDEHSSKFSAAFHGPLPYNFYLTNCMVIKLVTRSLLVEGLRTNGLHILTVTVDNLVFCLES